MPKIDLRKKSASYFSIVVTDETSDEVQELLEEVEQKDEFCDGWLPSDLANKFAGTYLILKAKRTQIILGFAILKEYAKTLHIKVICSNNRFVGAGTILMVFIKEYAKINKFKKITLKSLYQAIPFYQKMGFDTNCVPDSSKLCSMSFKV
jgi:hypothetical protein